MNQLNKKDKTLIIGMGEVGKALAEVLSEVYEVVTIDKGQENELKFDVVNICFPFSEQFVEQARAYAKYYLNSDGVMIIHSTVPVGTTRNVGPFAVHSPVQGRHEQLANGIRAFIKIVGGANNGPLMKAREFIKSAGMKCVLFSSPESSELAKILDTTYYGWVIAFMKDAIRVCEENSVPFFEVYEMWNNAYNQGYQAMGENAFTRPVLKYSKGKIGGHCVTQNLELLDDPITKVVKDRNATF